MKFNMPGYEVESKVAIFFQLKILSPISLYIPAQNSKYFLSEKVESNYEEGKSQLF